MAGIALALALVGLGIHLYPVLDRCTHLGSTAKKAEAAADASQKERATRATGGRARSNTEVATAEAAAAMGFNKIEEMSYGRDGHLAPTPPPSPPGPEDAAAPPLPVRRPSASSMRRKARKEFFNRKLFLFVQASENVNLFYVLVGATVIILAIAFLAFGYDTCANAYDFRSVMAHAFGEALGLGVLHAGGQAYSHAQQLMPPNCTDPLAGLALEAIAAPPPAAVAEALMYALRVDGAPVRNHGDCPTLDDVVGLYHLYPECDVRATTMPTPPDCNRVDHNTLLFRVFIYAGLPLFALMFALLIFIAVTKYQYRKMLKDYAQFRKDALVTGKRNRDKWLEVKYWEKVHAVEEYVQKRVECTIVMQRFVRGALERMHFRAVQKGVLMIQKHVRGMIQREDVCFRLRPQRIRTDPKFRREFMQLHAMMGERSQSLILVKHLEDLEEKLRLYVKALRDGKNFSARKATDKERKLEEECLKELGIGEQSAPTRLDNLAQDLARYILTPKVDESGNWVYLYPERPSGKRQKQFDRVPRAGKVPAHASALTMWEKTASFLDSTNPNRTSGADRRTSDDLDRGSRTQTWAFGSPRGNVLPAPRRSSLPSVSPHDLVKGAPPGLHEPFHGGWLIMQGDIEAYEVEEASVGVDRWRWAMPALHKHELELYAMDQATQTLVKEPADVLDLTNCKVMNALPRRGQAAFEVDLVWPSKKCAETKFVFEPATIEDRTVWIKMIEGRRDHGAGWVAPHAELEPSSTNPSHVPAWTMRHKCPKTAKVLRREKAAAEKDAAAKAAANSFAAANKYMRRGVHSSTLSATPSLASRRSSNVATPRGKRGSLPLGSLLRAASGASALSSRSRSRLDRNSTRGSVTFADVSLSTSSRYSSRGDDSGELSTIVEASASKPPSTSSDAKAPLSPSAFTEGSRSRNRGSVKFALPEEDEELVSESPV